MADIKLFKLFTNEEILAEIESESETEYVLCNTVGVSVVRQKDGTPGVGFIPFPLHAEQKTNATFVLNKKSVSYSYVPAQDFIDNYNSIFGAGIVLPPAKTLIKG